MLRKKFKGWVCPCPSCYKTLDLNFHVNWDWVGVGSFQTELIVVAKGITTTWSDHTMSLFWLLSLLNFYFLHVMPSTVFLNWCYICRKEKHCCVQKTPDGYVWNWVSGFYTTFLLELRSSLSIRNVAYFFFLILYFKKPKLKKFLAKMTGIRANKKGVSLYLYLNADFISSIIMHYILFTVINIFLVLYF